MFIELFAQPSFGMGRGVLDPVFHLGETSVEFAKSELNVIEEAIQEAARNDIRELNDLQLALVGGGIGDVIFL